ncbi:MerR family transcriptional regulator [bacterium]|nr:MerR family transcriptional regulator [bacterium]
MRPVFLIGDLASLTGLSIHTLNYYIRIGLVKETARSDRSGYRLFDEETVKTLKKIIRLRQRQTPIREIVARKNNGIL